MKNPRLALPCLLLSLVPGCDLWGPSPRPPVAPPIDIGQPPPSTTDRPPPSPSPSCGGEGEARGDTGISFGIGLVGDSAKKTSEVPLECRGPNTYVIGIVERQWRCPVAVRVQPALSPAAAELCVRLSLPDTLAVVPAGSVTAQYTHCLISTELASRSTVQVEAYSAADARRCANKQCVNCIVAAAPGPCP